MGGALVSTGVCIIEFCHFHFFHWQCLFRCFFIISNIFFFFKRELWQTVLDVFSDTVPV